MKVLLFVILFVFAFINISLGQDAESFSQDPGLSFSLAEYFVFKFFFKLIQLVAMKNQLLIVYVEQENNDTITNQKQTIV